MLRLHAECPSDREYHRGEGEPALDEPVQLAAGVGQHGMNHVEGELWPVMRPKEARDTQRLDIAVGAQASQPHAGQGGAKRFDRVKGAAFGEQIAEEEKVVELRGVGCGGG